MSTRAHEATAGVSPFEAMPRATTSASDVETTVLLLFDARRDQLLRYVCAFGIGLSDGEDLIQDVFLALFTHLTRGGSRSNLQGWLFRVAHNLALKRLARRQRDRARRGSGDGAAVGEASDPSHDPEQQLAHDRRRERLVCVLEALPERDRRCLHLRGDGLRYRDIARILDISLGSVAKSLTRTMARLQRADVG